MRRFAALSLILMLLLSLCACDFLSDAYEPAATVWTNRPADSTQPVTEEPTAEPTVTEPTESQPVLSVEAQLALFAVNRELWLPTEYFDLPFSFAVTDLDQNGRLELFYTVCMGTGIFSYNRAWMVNEKGDGIVACDDIFQTEESQPDIIYDEFSVYLDREGRYHYVVMDAVRSGWMFTACIKYAMTLEDEQLSLKLLARFTQESDLDGNQTVSCVDGADVPISEEEFDVYEGMYFSECIPMTVSFSWQMLSEEEVSAMDADAWYSTLEQSWAGFSLK